MGTDEHLQIYIVPPIAVGSIRAGDEHFGFDNPEKIQLHGVSSDGQIPSPTASTFIAKTIALVAMTSIHLIDRAPMLVPTE